MLWGQVAYYNGWLAVCSSSSGAETASDLLTLLLPGYVVLARAQPPRREKVKRMRWGGDKIGIQISERLSTIECRGPSRRQAGQHNNNQVPPAA